MILCKAQVVDNLVGVWAARLMKRRKPYFRFDARAVFDVSMVTG